jgi:predicted membrane chloride channel (bestrophin family)
LPFIFTPTLVFNLSNHPSWIIYALSVLHGFILISLYNLQDHIEDPFDQMGLDDIKLVEFKFKEQLDESLVQEAVAETAADAKS